jgi:hypothetical protein
MRSEAQGRAVSRTCNENGSEQVPAVGGGNRGAGHSKRKDSAEGAVVVFVVDAHSPRTPHDHMDRVNCPFADEQLDFSIDSSAKNVEYFLHPFNILRRTTRSCTPSGNREEGDRQSHPMR